MLRNDDYATGNLILLLKGSKKAILNFSLDPITE